MAHDEYEHQRRQTAAMQDAVNRTFERIEMARQTGTVPPRPCCHATGPNHHPACTTNRTEQQQVSTQPSTRSSGGIGLTGAVFIVFLVLKLVGVIDWSWWWVTSPLWISALVGIAFLVVFLIIAAVAK